MPPVKTRSTYIKAFETIKERCEYVWNNNLAICQSCPFHIIKPDRVECYFEHIGGKPPREWNKEDLGKML